MISNGWDTLHNNLRFLTAQSLTHSFTEIDEDWAIVKYSKKSKKRQSRNILSLNEAITPMFQHFWKNWEFLFFLFGQNKWLFFLFFWIVDEWINLAKPIQDIGLSREVIMCIRYCYACLHKWMYGTFKLQSRWIKSPTVQHTAGTQTKAGQPSLWKYAAFFLVCFKEILNLHSPWLFKWLVT